jgi:hypothetical protein
MHLSTTRGVKMLRAQARWLTGQLLYVGGGWRMPQ